MMLYMVADWAKIIMKARKDQTDANFHLPELSRPEPPIKKFAEE